MPPSAQEQEGPLSEPVYRFRGRFCDIVVTSGVGRSSDASAAFALSHLRFVLHDEENRRERARLLGDLGFADLGNERLDLADRMRIEAELFAVLERRFAAQEVPHPRFLGAAPDTWVPPPAVVAPVLSWIGLWLVDQDGKPVPGRPYRVIASDGTSRAGVLDDQGSANLTGLVPGTCQVYCPDVDSHPALTYAATDGDHASGIAQANGFDDFNPLWKRSENASLRALRPDPHLLVEGDPIFVPALSSSVTSKPTAADHTFVIWRSPLKLRLKLLGPTGKPVASTACRLDGTTLTTGGDGLVEAPVDKLARTLSLTLESGDVAVAVGALEPSAQPTTGGWRARLFNLGFLLDPEAEEGDDELQIAVEDFQADQSLPVTGTIDDATQNALKTAHGS